MKKDMPDENLKNGQYIPELEDEEDLKSRLVTKFPPCVGCKYNDGALECKKCGVKPERVVIGHEPCEFREEE